MTEAAITSFRSRQTVNIKQANAFGHKKIRYLIQKFEMVVNNIQPSIMNEQHMEGDALVHPHHLSRIA